MKISILLGNYAIGINVCGKPHLTHNIFAINFELLERFINAFTVGNVADKPAIALDDCYVVVVHPDDAVEPTDGTADLFGLHAQDVGVDFVEHFLAFKGYVVIGKLRGGENEKRGGCEFVQLKAEGIGTFEGGSRGFQDVFAALAIGLERDATGNREIAAGVIGPGEFLYEDKLVEGIGEVGLLNGGFVPGHLLNQLRQRNRRRSGSGDRRNAFDLKLGRRGHRPFGLSGNRRGGVKQADPNQDESPDDC